MTTRNQEIIILHGGDSLNGVVHVKEFLLKTRYGDLIFKKKQILAIEYKNPPFADVDEVQVDAGTRLGGELFPEVIPFEPASTGQVIQIPKGDIHSIVLFITKRRASKATRDAVAKGRSK
jgi:hypothetical protein